MPKSIWFPDEDYEQLVTLAKRAGFRVSRGRGSQLRLFVMTAANNCVQSDVCHESSDGIHQWYQGSSWKICAHCGTRR